MIVAICGNTGTGKTTFAKALAARNRWTYIAEPIDQNPFLALANKDPKRWSYALQVYFLVQRFTAQFEAKQNPNQVFVVDRILSEGAGIFVPYLFEKGYLTAEEFRTYNELADKYSRLLEAPDTMYYLFGSAEIIATNIKKRNRTYEQDVNCQRIEEFNLRYEKWFSVQTVKNRIKIDINHLHLHL